MEKHAFHEQSAEDLLGAIPEKHPWLTMNRYEALALVQRLGRMNFRFCTIQDPELALYAAQLLCDADMKEQMDASLIALLYSRAWQSDRVRKRWSEFYEYFEESAESLGLDGAQMELGTVRAVVDDFLQTHRQMRVALDEEESTTVLLPQPVHVASAVAFFHQTLVAQRPELSHDDHNLTRRTRLLLGIIECAYVLQTQESFFAEGLVISDLGFELPQETSNVARAAPVEGKPARLLQLVADEFSGETTDALFDLVCREPVWERSSKPRVIPASALVYGMRHGLGECVRRASAAMQVEVDSRNTDSEPAANTIVEEPRRVRLRVG